MGSLIGALQSLALAGIVAGTFLWDPKPADETFLGVGPRISIRHNEPSPAQAALEDTLALDDIANDPGPFVEVEKAETLQAGQPLGENLLAQVYGDERSRMVAISPRNQFPRQELSQYVPRPTVRITKSDLLDILRSLDHQQIQEEQQPPADVVKVDTAQGTPIVISRSIATEEKQTPSPSTASSRSPRHNTNPISPRETSRSSRVYTRSEDGVRGDVAFVHPSEVDWGFRGLRLSGNIAIMHGLIFNPDEHVISLHHRVDGMTMETAEINIERAEFYIPVSEAAGQLVVEMRTHQGQLVGAGSMPLIQLPTIPVNTDEVSNLIVEIAPKTENIEGQVISAYSYKTNVIPAEDAVVSMRPFEKFVGVKADGMFKDQDFQGGSAAIIDVSQQGHWSSISRLVSGYKQQVKMYADRDIASIYSSLFGEIHPADLKQYAIIKGKVVKNGKGFSGAKVEVEGDFAQAIYYEYFLPRAELQQTTSSGEFIIFTKAVGPRYIRVHVNGLSYPATWVPLQPGHVSEVNFDLSFEQVKNIEVLDGFSGDRLEGVGRYLGVPDEVPVQDGRLDLLKPTTRSELEFDLDLGENYPLFRFVVDGSSRLSVWPVLSFEALETLMGRSMTQDSCPVVGWFTGDVMDLSVYRGDKSIRLSSDKIVYFDEKGERVEGPVSGGGFILDESEEEILYLQAVPTQGSRIHSRYILRDPRICQSVLF